MSYDNFLQEKKLIFNSVGLTVSRDELHNILFGFQKDLVRWALMKGKAALFTMTGTGKTLMQLEWARQIHQHTGDTILIVAPLAVSHQTVREGKKIDVSVNICKYQKDVIPGINITNYDRLHNFDADQFGGIVLDESSILKSYDGKTRTMIIEKFQQTPFKLACTATPAPNDFMELGNHSEFLGVMGRMEMLSMFFVHDGGDTAKWRLKGHAQDKFWEWVASWAAVLSKPSDLGYEDDGFDLPPLQIHEHMVESEPIEGRLFVIEAQTLQERQGARRESTMERVQKCADLVNNSDKPFLVWCGLNYESSELKKAIPDAIEVKGSDSNEHKEKAMLDFSEGNIRVMVTKPSIAGFGMNWQHCSEMAFVGLSDSFEQYFQAVRRCWRFGQESPVNVHIIISEAEGAVKANINRKEQDALRMIEEMVNHTKEITKKNIGKTTQDKTDYLAEMEMILPNWIGGAEGESNQSVYQ